MTDDENPEWTADDFAKAQVAVGDVVLRNPIPSLIEGGYYTMKNSSGFIPLDVRVLVLPDAVEDKTAGGIFLPEAHKEREKFATMKGVLVAVGTNAWAEAGTNAAFTAPKPGQRVLIAKYGGIVVRGDDGQDYRIMNDEDVIGVIEETGK